MDNPAYGLTFRRDGDGLRAEVVGERTFDNTVAYWEGIVERIKAQRPRWLLVCDELRGNELSSSTHGAAQFTWLTTLLYKST